MCPDDRKTVIESDLKNIYWIVVSILYWKLNI